MKRKIISICFLSAFTTSLLHAKNEEITFTVATCNILSENAYSTQVKHQEKVSFQNRTQSFITALQKNDPDIMCLQEIDENWSSFFTHTNEIAQLGYAFIYDINAKNQADKPNFVVGMLYKTNKFSIYTSKNIHIISENIKNVHHRRNRALTAILQYNLDSRKPKIAFISCHIPQDDTVKDGRYTIYEDYLATVIKYGTTEVGPKAKQINNILEEFPVIICGDFNYNTYIQSSSSSYPSSKSSKPWKTFDTFFPVSTWNTPILESFPNDQDSNKTFAERAQNLSLNPTSYYYGFSLIDYIFYTKQLPSKKWILKATSYTAYPDDLKLLLKHVKPAGYQENIDGKLSSDYFSDHAIIKVTFKLTIPTDAQPLTEKDLLLFHQQLTTLGGKIS